MEQIELEAQVTAINGDWQRDKPAIARIEISMIRPKVEMFYPTGRIEFEVPIAEAEGVFVGKKIKITIPF